MTFDAMNLFIDFLTEAFLRLWPLLVTGALFIWVLGLADSAGARSRMEEKIK